MKSSYQNRVSEALKIKKHINKSPYPVIVCGDFNDTPLSYTYSTLKKVWQILFKNLELVLEILM